MEFQINSSIVSKSKSLNLKVIIIVGLNLLTEIICKWGLILLGFVEQFEHYSKMESS